MKVKIPNNLMKGLNKIGCQLQKNSPEIMIIAGAIGAVASTVMACHATTKISTIMDEAKETIDVIHETVENPEKAEVYSVKDSNRDLAITYAQTGWKLVKLYAPSAALGVFSLGLMIKSNGILRKRNIALAAAYATVETNFKDYRSRVIEKFGEEIDKELKFNVKAREIEETTTDAKGKEKTVKKTVEVTDIDEASTYARYFDKRSERYEDNPEYNMMFLKAQEQYANDLLKRNKYLFLNDVYDMLDIPRSEAGQSVGWVYDDENPLGDNYVDFGIFRTHRELNRDFVNGYEPVILLDFNCDGNIIKRFQSLDKRNRKNKRI